MRDNRTLAPCVPQIETFCYNSKTHFKMVRSYLENGAEAILVKAGWASLAMRRSGWQKCKYNSCCCLCIMKNCRCISYKYIFVTSCVAQRKQLVFSRLVGNHKHKITNHSMWPLLQIWFGINCCNLQICHVILCCHHKSGEILMHRSYLNLQKDPSFPQTACQNILSSGP